MATATYYFNSYTSNSNWINPEKIADSYLDIFATATMFAQLTLDSNNCGAALNGTITKIELRSYGKAYPGDTSNDRTKLIPIFTDGNGNDHTTQWTSVDASWSDWYDITTDTNAPVSWTWEDVKNLQCYCQSVNNSSGNRIAKVQLRVTYTPCSSCTTFTVTGSSYTVNLYAPIWNGEDNKIIKDIDRKSFWSGNYEVNDDGINSQPLVLTGIEFAACDNELCGISFEGGAPFSLCFNMRFTNKMRFLAYMADNNEEVTISGLGDCMDGVYIIKHFHYDTIEKTVNAYAWNMTLEKVRGN